MSRRAHDVHANGAIRKGGRNLGTDDRNVHLVPARGLRRRQQRQLPLGTTPGQSVDYVQQTGHS